MVSKASSDTFYMSCAVVRLFNMPHAKYGNYHSTLSLLSYLSTKNVPCTVEQTRMVEPPTATAPAIRRQGNSRISRDPYTRASWVSLGWGRTRSDILPYQKCHCSGKNGLSRQGMYHCKRPGNGFSCISYYRIFDSRLHCICSCSGVDGPPLLQQHRGGETCRLQDEDHALKHE